MKAKKTFLLLGFCISLTVLCGCAKQEETAAAEVEEGPVELDWYVNFSWYKTPWGGNVVSDKITEDTGVSINFITPQGNEEEKLKAMISSDNLPDMITLDCKENAVDEMINQGMVYALNELADTYEPYFWKVADEEIIAWDTQEDGNIYFYPNSAYTKKDYEVHPNIPSNQTFLVRKDIYEALGCPDMTTQEGFADAVRRAASQFKAIDGSELIPVGAHEFTNTGCPSFDTYLQNFLAVPYEKDGKYNDRYTDEDYISWLKMFRQLGEEGYLKDDIFIDQRVQMEEKIANGQYFCMIFQRTDLATQQIELYAHNPEQIYMAVEGPKNQAGDDPRLPGGSINGWTVTLLSKKCRFPEKAMQLLTYMISEEGQKVIYLGVEGVTYDMVDGKPVIRKEVQDLKNTNRNEYDAVYGADDTYWMLQNNAMQLPWSPEPAEPNGQMEIWTYPYSFNIGPYDITFKYNTPENEADKKIKQLWGETLPQLLLASDEASFDAILEKYIVQRKELGFDMVMQASTEQMQEAKRKMDLE